MLTYHHKSDIAMPAATPIAANLKANFESILPPAVVMLTTYLNHPPIHVEYDPSED